MNDTLGLTPSIILSLETAMLGGSVFLGTPNTVLATRKGDPKISHSNSLLGDISACLDEAGLALQDIDLFACASGPGSFTGLRIGIATLKALAATLNRSCAGVPTLNAVAHSAGASSRTVALLPAGRGELFAQMFSVSENGEVKELDQLAHLSPQRLMAKYAVVSNLIWAGEGAHLHQELLRTFAGQQGFAFSETIETELGWRVAPRPENLGQNVAVLALQMFQRNELQTPDTLQAIYVRPSDAELNQQCQ
jgi:tRNA threonylcarbamoyladenosine biosynthesis protein TsaB